MKLTRGARRTWTAVLLAAVMLASSLVVGAASPASAVTPPDPVVVPPTEQATCYPPWVPVGPCMEIPSSGTVMRDVTAHLIFWLPDGYSFAPGVPDGDARHMALVERLINDLSGSETYNLLTQYHDYFPDSVSVGNDPTHGYHPNRIRVGGTYVETRPFPRAPLSQSDIEAEITQVSPALGHSSRSADFRQDIFFVFTPVGVQTCLNAPGLPDVCSGTQFAGFHSWYQEPLVGSTSDCAQFDPEECALPAYVYLPTLVTDTSPPFPNNAFVDPVLDTMWQELAETVTNAWRTIGWNSASTNVNTRNFEVGDLCNPRLMPDGHGPRGGDGGTVTLNGNRYLLQRIYSNAQGGCTLGFHGQFVNFRRLAAKTTASPPFSLTADATSMLPVTFEAAGPCSVSGAVVTVTGVGSCTITASQAGDRPAGGFYHPAAPVTQTFAITQAPPVVVPGAGSVVEGNSGTTTLSVPVTLSHASSETVTVDWETIDSLAQPQVGVDFESASGTVTFLPGETSGTASFTVYGDTLDENTLYNAEWAGVMFHSPTNATIGAGFGALGFAFILDDDPAPTITPVGAAVLEGDVGDTTLLLRVELSAPSGQAVSVKWATLDSAAQPKAGVDYAPGSGTLTFAPGETSKTVPFVVHGDTVDEPGQLYNSEWGGITLSAPTNAGFGTGLFARTGLALIVDDD